MRAAVLLVITATIALGCGRAAVAPAMTPPGGAIGASPAVPAAGGAGPASPAAATTSGPAFLSTALTDVRTGETFRIGAFPGKVVLVIAMAVW